jgi:[ribosomal protein S5]-alanine N-acetyltransferase
MDVRGGELRFVDGSIELFDAELAGDHVRLARLLGVHALQEWPPIDGEHDLDAVAFFRAALLSGEASSEWLAYYVCLGSLLVGSAGFLGPPRDGVAEIGYSICLMYRGQGIATRVVAELVERAERAGARRLIAHTTASNLASLAVLESNGFRRSVSDREAHLLLVRDLPVT